MKSSPGSADVLAYTTVLTVLRKLEGKGYVGHEEEGRAHRYHALIEREAAQEGALKALVSKLFKGSGDALLMHLCRASGSARSRCSASRSSCARAHRKEKP